MNSTTPTNKEYIARINRVLDYIEQHLSNELSLDELARVACFSKYHFHRIFASIVGETLFQFIRRLRLEKSASMLGTSNKSITEIAFDCGFETSAAFAKSFKKQFGVSASDFRSNPKGVKSSDYMKMTNSNMGQTLRNGGEALRISRLHIDRVTHTQTWRFEMNNKKREVKIVEIPETNVAYVRHVGPYKGDAALFEGLYNKMFAWAGPRGLIQDGMYSYVIYHDDPEITEEAKLRTSVCFPVPEGTQTDGEIGSMSIPKGKYAVCHFEIEVSEYPEAWGWMYGTWLPQSGFEPDERPCFERYLHVGEHDPEAKCKVDICIPVNPLK